MCCACCGCTSESLTEDKCPKEKPPRPVCRPRQPPPRPSVPPVAHPGKFQHSLNANKISGIHLLMDELVSWHSSGLRLQL